MTLCPREKNRILAWAKINTSGAVLSSFNVQGCVKNSTGNYTVSFLKRFPNSDYCALFIAEDNSSSIAIPKIISKTQESVTMEFRGGTVNILGIAVILNSVVDPSIGLNMIICGDP